VIRPIRQRDPILGLVRRCPSCRQWLPDDAEFFEPKRYTAGTIARSGGHTYTRRTSGVTWRCRACVDETQRASDARRATRYTESRNGAVGVGRNPPPRPVALPRVAP